jgi:hypothetical protein
MKMSMMMKKMDQRVTIVKMKRKMLRVLMCKVEKKVKMKAWIGMKWRSKLFNKRRCN